MSEKVLTSKDETRISLLIDAADDCVEYANSILRDAPNMGVHKEQRCRREAAAAESRAKELREWADEIRASRDGTSPHTENCQVTLLGADDPMVSCTCRTPETSAQAGPFVVADSGSRHGEHRFRTMQQGCPAWTLDLDEALQFARKKDAEAFAAEDDDAWHILPVGRTSPAETTTKLADPTKWPMPPPPETWMPAWLREFHCQCESTGEGAGQCVACQAADLIEKGAVKASRDETGSHT